MSSIGDGRRPPWPGARRGAFRRIYDMASADKLLISGYHFPFPGLGYIEKAGSGYRLIPASWSPVI